MMTKKVRAVYVNPLVRTLDFRLEGGFGESTGNIGAGETEGGGVLEEA